MVDRRSLLASGAIALPVLALATTAPALAAPSDPDVTLIAAFRRWCAAILANYALPPGLDDDAYADALVDDDAIASEIAAAQPKTMMGLAIKVHVHAHTRDGYHSDQPLTAGTFYLADDLEGDLQRALVADAARIVAPLIEEARADA